MESKCNKNQSKYLDHLYCHSSESRNHIRANNNAINSGGTVSSGQDVMALLKENKQLKAMLILHMDLIQEQSDQLMAKDKVLNNLRDDAEALKSKNLQLETQVLELQKQLQRQMKRVVAGGAEVSTLPPPPLAKIQCKVEAESNSLQAIRPEEIKYQKEEQTNNEARDKVAKAVKTNYKIQENASKSKTMPGNQKSCAVRNANIIGECNGKLISKIILHRVDTASLHSPVSTASDSASELEEATREPLDDESVKLGGKSRIHNSQALGDGGGSGGGAEDRTLWYEMEDSNDEIPLAKRAKRASNLKSKGSSGGGKPHKSVSRASPNKATKVATVQPTEAPLPPPSRGGKQMPLMLTHAPDLHSDESASCDSVAEAEQQTTGIGSPAFSLSPKDGNIKPLTLGPPTQHTSHHHNAKARRCGYISTTQRYCTRAWEDEEFNCDYDSMRGDISPFQSDMPPTLEIPKWTEHEIPVSYSVECTEDLSDDTYLKRHAKLELDEKRRKKWDVQQIREQRRIEKLKRRHCKDELQTAPEPQQMLSFYPSPDSIQMICYVNDLPVQAFGELIPKLNTSGEFVLPWLDCSHVAASSSQTGGFKAVTTFPAAKANASQSQQVQHQMLNTSFVFMKKRRRQQSASGNAAGGGRPRPIGAVAAKTAVSTTSANNTNAPPCTVTTAAAHVNASINSMDANKNEKLN